MPEPPIGPAKDRRRSRRVLTGAVLVAIVLGGLVVAGIYYFIHRSPTSLGRASVVWQSPASGLSAGDKRSIGAAVIAARNAGDSALSIGGNGRQPQFVITQVQRSGQWAVLSAAVHVNPAAGVLAAEPVFFIAHAHGSGWTLAFPSSASFCALLRQLPSGLVYSADYQYFGC